MKTLSEMTFKITVIETLISVIIGSVAVHESVG